MKLFAEPIEQSLRLSAGGRIGLNSHNLVQKATRIINIVQFQMHTSKMQHQDGIFSMEE